MGESDLVSLIVVYIKEGGMGLGGRREGEGRDDV